jgi:O-Antigen ligase
MIEVKASKYTAIAFISAICFSYVITITLIIQYSLPIGITNTFLKIFILAILFLSSFIYIIKYSSPNQLQISLMVFFLIYSFKLMYNVIILDEYIEGQSLYQILGYYFGLTIIPVIFIVFYIKPIDSVYIHRISFAFLAAGNVALLLHTMLNGDVYIDAAFAGRTEVDGDILGTAVLNPIVVGHTGTLLMVFCLGRIATGLVRGLPSLGFHGMLMLLGLANLLAGGSRGPLFGLLSSIMLLVAVAVFRRNAFKTRYGRNLVWLFLAGVALIFVFLMITDRVPVFLFDRVVDTVSGRMEGQLEERDYAIASAWDIFRDSPLFGSSYTINGSLAHNVVMEMLMATGILGAVFFYGLVHNAVVGVWRLACGHVGPYGLSIALVTVAYAALGLTSYSIVQSPELWIFIAISSTLGRFALGPDGQFYERTQFRS